MKKIISVNSLIALILILPLAIAAAIYIMSGNNQVGTFFWMYLVFLSIVIILGTILRKGIEMFFGS